MTGAIKREKVGEDEARERSRGRPGPYWGKATDQPGSYREETSALT